MQAKKKTAPEQSATKALLSARSGASWCEHDIQPASRKTWRTRGWCWISFRRLRCWTENVRSKLISRDPSDPLNLQNPIRRHPLPLKDRGRCHAQSSRQLACRARAAKNLIDWK
jgi:hypothetical protein